MTDDDSTEAEESIESFVARALLDMGIGSPASTDTPIVSRDQLKEFTRRVIQRLAQPQFYAEDLNELIQVYDDTLSQIHAAFGYKEDWRAIPLDDQRHCWWFLRENEVVFGDDEHPYDPQGIHDGHCYINEIYRQRYLPKWVYETPTHTMICVDTHTDGNKFLQIFTNANRKPVIDESGNVVN